MSNVCAFLSCLVVALAAAAAPAADGAAFADFDRRAKAGERLNVVFFGASLTWGANATDHATTSYRARLAERLEQRYPQAHFFFKDAAIGGTGSQLGVFRVERDVLRWKPDLVFLDFSANDDIYSDDTEMLASYEAIVRRLVSEAKVPVVQVAFPFQWNIKREDLPKMKRLAAHRAIAEAYGCGWGDAITLIIDRVEAGSAKISALWDSDPVHPGDTGYALFAEAAWIGFTAALDAGKVCRAPAQMLHAATYTTAKRIRLDGLGALPAGWTTGKPHLTSIYYDFLMSRWVDGLVVANSRRERKDAQGNPEKGADGQVAREAQPVASLKLSVQASAILLFGEASESSGRFKVLVDGQPVVNHSAQTKGDVHFDANRWKKGSGHLVIEVARGLDPEVAHSVEIVPVFTDGQDQELRLESICVAGNRATVVLVP
ncbi:MAG: SGNH/GDSL hydrolase family protein [Planctomycetes bacterium]|nr:SGNH/GDSL hydrolase family protein [Planctomycetota bacterium]